MAVTVLAGDRRLLSKCDPKVLGWVTSGDGFSIEDAETAAAEHGGTHITARTTRDRVEGYGYQTWTTTTVTYVVLRVPEECWSSLPDVMRPSPLPESKNK